MAESPKLTIELEQYDEIRARVSTLQKENGELKAQLGDAQMKADGGDGKLAYQLTDALRRALKVVQFAQGNLDPETIRGWPHADLIAVADAILALPVVTDQEKEWATDAKRYARVAALLERARAKGVQGQVASIQRPAVAGDDDNAYERQVQQIIDAAP